MDSNVAFRQARRLWKYRDLIANLVRKDVRVRYLGSVMGFGWSLVNPLVITLAYLVVFTYIFRSGLPNFALYLVIGVLHWNLMAVVVGQSSEMLVANANILKKIYFPRLAIPIASFGVNLVFWCSNLAVFLVLFGLLGGHLSVAMLLYPFYLGLYAILIFGVSLLLSAIYVRFRDVKHLVDVFLQLLFWATPVVYSLAQVPWRLKVVLALNPVANALDAFRAMLYSGNVPTLQSTVMLTLWAIGAISAGLLAFRQTPDLIELL